MGKHRPHNAELKKLKSLNNLLIERLKRRQSLEETTAESSATSSHERQTLVDERDCLAAQVERQEATIHALTEKNAMLSKKCKAAGLSILKKYSDKTERCLLTGWKQVVDYEMSERMLAWAQAEVDRLMGMIISERQRRNVQDEKIHLLDNVETMREEIATLKGLQEESVTAQFNLETALKGARAMADGLNIDFQREKKAAKEANDELIQTKAQMEENEELLRIASDSVSDLSARLDEVETRGRLEDKALHAMLNSKYAHERIKKDQLQTELDKLSQKARDLEQELYKKSKQLEDIKKGNLSKVDADCQIKKDLESVRAQCKAYESDIEKFQSEISKSLDRIGELENTITTNTEAAAEREVRL